MDRIDDPSEILEHVATTFKPLFEERNIHLEIKVTEPLPKIVGDRDRLIQVFTNLCSNAMKYTPPRGTVELHASSDQLDGKLALRMEVQDTGPGIPPDQLEHVFERFHQVKESKNTNKPKGTGLGLAICREVVAHHGGSIWAEAPTNGGARMVVVIPIPESASKRSPAAREAAAQV